MQIDVSQRKCKGYMICSLKFDRGNARAKGYMICSLMFVREIWAGITTVAQTQPNRDGLDRSTFRKSQTRVCKIHNYSTHAVSHTSPLNTDTCMNWLPNRAGSHIVFRGQHKKLRQSNPTQLQLIRERI